MFATKYKAKGTHTNSGYCINKSHTNKIVKPADIIFEEVFDFNQLYIQIIYTIKRISQILHTKSFQKGHQYS